MPPSPLRRRLLWLLLAALALGVMVIVLRSGPDSSGVRVRLDRLRAAGLPTTPAELEVWYAAPPPALNMAQPLLDAAAALRGADRQDTNLPWVGRAPVPPNGVPLEALLRTQMEGFVRTNQEALNAARVASERPRSRYPVVLSSGPWISLPHLNPIRNVVGSLVLEAVLAAEQRNGSLVAEDLVAGIRVTDSLALVPVHVSAIYSQKLYELLFQGSERVFNQRVLTDVQLQALQQTWSNSLSVLPAGHIPIGMLAIHEPLRSMSTPNVLKIFDSNSDSSVKSLLTTARLAIHSAVGGLRIDYAVLVEFWDEQRLAAQLEYPERLDQEAKLQATLAGRLSSRYLPVARNLAYSDGQWQAQAVTLKRIALMACAVERYRLRESGRLPERLDQLVPDFVPGVLGDPFDGRPLRYAVQAGGYVIYSVGPDKQDDGGRPNQGYQKEGGPRADISFSVEPTKQ